MRRSYQRLCIGILASTALAVLGGCPTISTGLDLFKRGLLTLVISRESTSASAAKQIADQDFADTAAGIEQRRSGALTEREDRRGLRTWPRTRCCRPLREAATLIIANS